MKRPCLVCEGGLLWDGTSVHSVGRTCTFCLGTGEVDRDPTGTEAEAELRAIVYVLGVDRVRKLVEHMPCPDCTVSGEDLS